MSMYQQKLMNNKKIFLINNNQPIEFLEKNILEAPYVSLSESFSSARFRGTKILKKDNKYHIITWQRNIARLQKMDVSLPTIVSLLLDNEMIIKSISLSESFAGSQGISCSYKYLFKILKQNLLGKKFDLNNKKLFAIDKLHCVHLYEILSAALSSMEEIKIKNLDEFDEVETSQAFEEGNDIKFVDYQQTNNGLFLNWEIIFYNYKKTLKFNANGEIKKIDNLNVVFRFIRDEDKDIYFNQVINGDTNKSIISQLLKFAIHCRQIIINQIGVKNDFLHSNSLPISFIGLIIQSLGIVIFSNNYNYIQHILAALQRKDDKPMCIGIAKNIEEAQIHFPQFSVEDLY